MRDRSENHSNVLFDLEDLRMRIKRCEEIVQQRNVTFVNQDKPPSALRQGDPKATVKLFDLEQLISHPGYFEWSRSLLLHLDLATISKLCLVSKATKEFVTKQRHWWFLKLKFTFNRPIDFLQYFNTKMFYHKQSIIEAFPWYEDFLEYVRTNQAITIVGLRDLIYLFDQYLNYRSVLGGLDFCSPFVKFMRHLNPSGSLGSIKSPPTIRESYVYFVKCLMNSPIDFKITEDFQMVSSAIDAMNFSDFSIETRTPFLYNCYLGNDCIVSLLLKYAKSRNIDVRSGYPLHLATKNGYKKVVKILLENHEVIGLDVNATDQNQKTAIELARENHDDSIVEMLSLFDKCFVNKKCLT